MNKFEKAVTTSALSMAAAAGFLALGSHTEHVATQDKQHCYELQGSSSQKACLADAEASHVGVYGSQYGMYLGLIGGLAAGVQAYRALDKQPLKSEL
ncbi:MAG: hypothetical protein QFB87_03870 [Patescibacteria group bacterium]|nr:hypothetical protein [Patescibacteria group bacterium]